MPDNRLEDYKDLIVWKRAMELATAAYKVTQKLPREENYAIRFVGLPYLFHPISPKAMAAVRRKTMPGFFPLPEVPAMSLKPSCCFA